MWHRVKEIQNRMPTKEIKRIIYLLIKTSSIFIGSPENNSIMITSFIKIVIKYIHPKKDIKSDLQS